MSKSFSCKNLRNTGSRLLFGKVLPILVFLALSSCTLSPIFAQLIPVHAYYQPTTFADGDEISLVINVGTENYQVEWAQALQVKIQYDEFEISSSSEISQNLGTASWFGGDGNYYGTHYIDHNNKQIIVNLFRNNGTAVSGYGYTTKLAGIVIEMEEIYGKKAIEPASVQVALMQDVKNKLGISWTYQGSDERILIQNFGESTIQQIKVYNLNGQEIILESGDVRQISTSKLPAQAYMLQIDTDQGSFSEKLLIN